ncbi:MAG: hypothetical protein RL112_910 [Planctomycetota bacterium]
MQMRTNHGGNQARRRRRGGALVVMTMCVVGMAGLSTAMLALALRHSGEGEASKARLAADYACQATLALSVQNLQRAADPALGLGSPAQPASFGGWSTTLVARDLDTVESQSTPLDYQSGLVELVASASGGRGGARQVLVLRAVPNTIWRFGAFGKEFLHLDSNARVDSYDSRLGTYESQLVASATGSNAHARQNGDVGSNGDVSLDQNAKVHGDSIAGMDHETIVLGNAFVTGARATNTAEVELPPISVPSYVNYGNMTVNSSTVFNASNRTYGTLRVGSNKTLTIMGPANIVASSLVLNSGAKIAIDDSAGPVVLYVLDNFIMNSNTSIRPNSLDPSKLTLNLLSDNVINPEVTVQLDTVDFDSNSKIWGVVYAPNARVVLDSNFELYGSLMARSLDVDSNATFHFDEALTDATASGSPIFETVAWRDAAWRE